MPLVRCRLVLCAAWAVVAAGAWSAEQRDHDAELPRDRVILETASNGHIIAVPAGGDLQAALDAARPGDTIELEAGAVFRGPFVLPRKSPTQATGDPASPRWITLRPGPTQRPLPDVGVRATPADAVAMAHLVSSRNAVMTTAPGASHFRFVGIGFRPGRSWFRPGFSASLNGLVWLDGDTPSSADVPHHFVFERCLFSGAPRVATRRGLVINSAHTAVLDSHFSGFRMRGEDAQAIVGWAGPGPFLLRNNYLEGSGENLMFGGADPAIPGLVPADIEIVGNHFAKPVAWREGTPEFEGTRWSVKNLFELKNAERVLVEGNLFEHNWPESQNGFAILFTVRNQEGGAPWSVVRDVTFRNNVVRRVGNGFNIAGYDDHYPSRQTRRITIRNNLFEEVGEHWGEGDLFQVLDGVEGLVIAHNTARHSADILVAEGRANERFVFEHNIVVHNQYGIVGTDMAPGEESLQRYFPGARITGNRIVGGSGQSYPEGNGFPSTFEAALREQRAPGGTDAGRASTPGAGADLVALCMALSVTERAVACPESEGASP